MIPLATALPSPGLPSLTLTSSALHDGALSHSLTVVSARGVAGGYRAMQSDRVLGLAACLFSTVPPLMTPRASAGWPQCYAPPLSLVFILALSQ